MKIKNFLFYTYLLFTSNNLLLAQDNCIADICFEKSIKKEEKLNLVGVSLYKYLFFDVYSAAYYADDKLNLNQLFDPNSERLLVLEYKTKISKKDFIVSTKKLLLNNLDINQAVVLPKFEKVYNEFEDVKAGDRYSLHYSPIDQKTCLALNSQIKVCDFGLDFYKAFFGIWLSNYSVDQNFTNKLLAKK